MEIQTQFVGLHKSSLVSQSLVLFILLLSPVITVQGGWNTLPLFDGKSAVFISPSEIGLLNLDEREVLKGLFVGGTPIICEGGEAELAELLGIDVVDTTLPVPNELFAVISMNNIIHRAHFIPAPKFQQQFVLYWFSVKWTNAFHG